MYIYVSIDTQMKHRGIYTADLNNILSDSEKTKSEPLSSNFSFGLKKKKKLKREEEGPTRLSSK